MKNREVWASRIGLILAAAGNAIGLGNLLRFPSKVALYGGGAFMIPYFISLILLGIPLMILEWIIGRYAGSKGHGSMVGIMGEFFNQSSIARAIGTFGVAIPFLIVCYYIYIESWTLGFAIKALLHQMPHPVITANSEKAMEPFLHFFKAYTTPSTLAVVFLVITIAMNWYLLHRGITRGIEVTAKIGIPCLLLMGIFLSIVSLSMNHWKGLQGLYFIFKPDFHRLSDMQVWVEAAGQIFFTLSLAMGAIATYASYVKYNEDVLKTGLYTAGLNEFVEVVIGGSIAIPAAFAIFGAASIPVLAKQGTFRLGFISMPAILMSLPYGSFLCFLWFALLFIAALTSSLALIQPMVALFEDEVNTSHSTAVHISMILVTIGAFLSAFVPKFIDDVDFWAGTLFLLLSAFIEIIAFVWLFGFNNFYKELTRDVFFKIPKSWAYIAYSVSLVFIAVLFYFWAIHRLPGIISQTSLNLLIARGFIAFTIVFLVILAIKSKPKRTNT